MDLYLVGWRKIVLVKLEKDMTNLFIQPNTRNNDWKEVLLAQSEGKKVILVEPDKVVLDFLSAEGVKFILVDPQHHGDATHSSAILMAAEMGYQSEDLLLIGGFKTDLDMLGAMALLTSEGKVLQERIDTIDSVDTGAFFGEWVPTQADNNVLLLISEEISDTKILGAMSADFKTPLNQKVAMMAAWLEGGEAPQQFKVQLLKEREELLKATVQILSGIKVVTCSSAGVSSLLYLDTEVAGEGRPFGLAFNPNFRGQGPKFSLLQFKNHYVNTTEFFARMNELEEAEGTWGGNPSLGIGGSPLGTTISAEVVAAELVNYLTDKGREYLIND